VQALLDVPIRRGASFMSGVKIDQGEWVVVCDGRKALVLENVGDDKFLNLKTREVYDQEDAKTSELGTDAPGRAINSVDARRSSMEQTDWHDQAENAFLETLARRLNAAVEAGEARKLVVVAPPRALGVLRQAYSSNLRDAVHIELDKDLVKLPVHEIEKHLSG
jgi:protein required for attachment to host cells